MTGTIRDITAFADRLNSARIHFDLSIIRADSVLFAVAVPGEHWEVEFMADGTVEIEIFESSGEISGAAKIDELFQRFSD